MAIAYAALLYAAITRTNMALDASKDAQGFASLADPNVLACYVEETYLRDTLQAWGVPDNVIWDLIKDAVKAFKF